MNLLFLFFIILISGCSQNNQTSPTYSSYPAFQSPADSLIVEYESLFKVSIDFPVYIDNEKTGVTSDGFKILGLCVIESTGQRAVYLNKTWWNSKTEQDQRVLLYHELTHCVFNRGHDSRKYANGMPYSIMSPVINPVLRFYKKYERYYLNEILNPESNITSPPETSTFITTEESCLLRE